MMMAMTSITAAAKRVALHHRRVVLAPLLLPAGRAGEGRRCTTTSASSSNFKSQQQNLPCPCRGGGAPPFGGKRSFSTRSDPGRQELGSEDLRRQQLQQQPAAAAAEPGAEDGFSTVDIHPLSRLVLLRLQEDHHDWVARQGLERGLKVGGNGGGTFSLSYPSKTKCVNGNTNGRIFTYLDPMNGKYWLLYRSDQTCHQFLLRDPWLPPSGGNVDEQRRGSEEEEERKVRDAVNDLVRTVNEIKYTVRIR